MRVMMDRPARWMGGPATLSLLLLLLVELVQAPDALGAGGRVELVAAEGEGAVIRRRLRDGASGEVREYVVGRTYEPRDRRRLQASTTDTIEGIALVEGAAAASPLVCLDKVPVSAQHPEGLAAVDCTKVDLRFSLRDGSSLGGFVMGVSGTAVYSPPVRCDGYVPGDASNPSTTCPIGCVFTPPAEAVAATTASCTGVADTPTESCAAPTCSIHSRDIGSDRPNLALTSAISCTGILGSSDNPLTGCTYTAPNPEILEDCAATQPDDADVARQCRELAVTATCDLDAATDSSADCPAGCASTEAYVPACGYADEAAKSGCPGGCTDDGSACTGTATEVAATCTGVSTSTYHDQSICENSGVACTYVAHVAEGSIVAEACDPPTCAVDTPGDADSCTGVETCTETQADQAEACAGTDQRCADVVLGQGYVSAQACAKITVDPPCEYTSGTDGCPAGCVDNGVTCEGTAGYPVHACTYNPGHVADDAAACAAVPMGTTLSQSDCEQVRTSADISIRACTFTPPNYGCIYNSDNTPTCDLDPATDGTAECPAGCEEVVDADLIPAVDESCDYPSLGSSPGNPMSNTVFTSLRVSVDSQASNYDCADGYISGTAASPSTTCSAGCSFVRAVDYVAAIPEECSGNATDPALTCDLDSSTDATDE
jgi:hypothetical protein